MTKNNKEIIEKDFRDLTKEDLISNLKIAVQNINKLEHKVNKRMNSKEGFAWSNGYRNGSLSKEKEMLDDEIRFLKEESDREIHKVGYPSDAIIKRIIKLEDRLQKLKGDDDKK